MLETVIVKFLGYGVFWNSRTRQHFRSKALGGIIRIRRFVWRSSLKSVPRSEGERLVERRVSIFGIPIFVRRSQRPSYRVALLVDEFFGGWDTAIGGYGALARKYICRFIPNEMIQIDLLLDGSRWRRHSAETCRSDDDIPPAGECFGAPRVAR